jgi:hypothetical protein
MRLVRGQIWRCMNEACRAQIQVTVSSGLAEEGVNPHCPCGSPMKRPYAKPQLRRAEDPAEVKRLLEQLHAVLR